MDPFPPNDPDNEHGLWIHAPMILVYTLIAAIKIVFCYKYYFARKNNSHYRDKATNQYNARFVQKWLLYFAFVIWFTVQIFYLIVYEILDTWGWILYVAKHLEVNSCFIPINYDFGQCWTTLASRRSYIFIDESNGNFTLSVFMAIVIISQPIIMLCLAYLLTGGYWSKYKPKFRFPGRDYVFVIALFFYIIATAVFILLAVKNVTYNGITPLGFILWMGITEQGVAYLAVVVIWGLLTIFPVIFFGHLMHTLIFITTALILLFISSIMTSGFFSAYSIFIVVAVIVQLLGLLIVVQDDQLNRKYELDNYRAAHSRSTNQPKQRVQPMRRNKKQYFNN